MNSELLLLSIIYTREDLEDAQKYVETLTTSLYNTKKSSFESFLSSLPQNIEKRLSSDLKNSSLPKDIFLKELSNALIAMEPISLTLAFYPSVSTTSKIASYVKKEYGLHVFLDLTYNFDLLAGAEISYKGTYKDYTSRHAFDKCMSQIKKDFFTSV